ncbi:hypothetical protein BDV98DRAFT_486901, partial [Pterulicium gracile]
ITLVDKEFNEIGTPLLYETIVLWTSCQAQALEHSLRKKLSRRAFVRALRIEGGFANSLKAICQGMLNLEDIALSM